MVFEVPEEGFMQEVTQNKEDAIKEVSLPRLDK